MCLNEWWAFSQIYPFIKSNMIKWISGQSIKSGLFLLYPRSLWFICVSVDFAIVYAALPSTCLTYFIQFFEPSWAHLFFQVVRDEWEWAQVLNSNYNQLWKNSSPLGIITLSKWVFTTWNGAGSRRVTMWSVCSAQASNAGFSPSACLSIYLSLSLSIYLCRILL